MKKIVFFLLILPQILFAQVSDEETACKNVYTDIITAIGNNSPIPPKFIFDKTGTSRVAYIRNNKIYFEKKAFDALAILGENQMDGVSFIMSHELAHHYLRHSWMRKVGYAYSSNEVGKFLKEQGGSINQRIIEETQADLYAGFFAHMAGYKALPVAAKTLDIIYQAYNLDTNLVGYPSLYDRKSIAEGKMEELAELALIFNIANLALVTGNYSESSTCYEYILNQEFTSREIYNNLGLSQLYSAVSLLGESKYKFYLPTLMDPETRGEGSPFNNLSDSGKIDKAIELLESSTFYFKTASNLDNKYIPSKVNKSTSLVLLASIDSTYRERMIQSFSVITTSEKNNLLGIYYVLIGDTLKSKEYLQRGKDAENTLARLNLELINNPKNIHKKGFEKVVIDNVDIKEIAALGLDKPYYRFTRIPNINMKIKKDSTSLIYTFNNGKVIQETKDFTLLNSEKIFKELSLSNIIDKYGKPDNIFSTYKDVYYVYEGIIIVFDNAKKKLKQVILFN